MDYVKKELKEKMPFEGFELAYETLAEAIDQAGEKREALFLTKLALLLAHEVGDIARFNEAVSEALEDIRL